MILRPPLLVVTDRRQAVLPLTDILAAAFAAGCRWASLRGKDLPTDEQVALARGLRSVADRYGARLTLHGDTALAVQAGLDGVHLAAGSDTGAARARLGRAASIGLSIHSAREARAIDPDLVDYAVAGPAFETSSKPGYGPALGIDGVRAIVAATSVPIIAIGGITAARVPALLGAGAAGVAVMGSVMRARDPAGEVRALLAALSLAQRAR